MLIDDDRCIFVDVFIDLRSIGRRQVQTAVRAVRFVNLATKRGTPRCVMKADIAVKGHPVFDFRVVALTAQGGISCLISQAVNALRRTVLTCRIARDEIALEKALAVFIEP